MAANNKKLRTIKIIALIITLSLWIILFNMSRTTHIPTGKVLDLSRCGNGIIEPNYGEQCEYNNDSACPGKCKFDCTCAYCGNNVLEYGEDCDGAWDLACPDHCQPKCKCPPSESRMLTNRYRQIVFYDVMEPGENFTFTSDFSDTSLQRLIIHSTTPLKDVNLYIDTNITKPVTALTPADFVYQYFNIDTQNTSRQQLAAEIDFKVPKDWYVKNDLNATATKLALNYGSWIALKTTLQSEDDSYFYYTSTSPVLALFAVTSEKYPVPKPIVPVCGNGIVESGETPETCCADAGCTENNESCINNKCTFVARCGNNICEQTETAENCPVDCGALVLFFPQFLAIFVTLVFVSGLTVIGHMKRLHEERKTRKRLKRAPVMPSLTSEEEQVEEYIKKHLKKGISENEIRKHLLSVGWERDFIDVKILEERSKVD